MCWTNGHSDGEVFLVLRICTRPRTGISKEHGLVNEHRRAAQTSSAESFHQIVQTLSVFIRFYWLYRHHCQMPVSDDWRNRSLAGELTEESSYENFISNADTGIAITLEFMQFWPHKAHNWKRREREIEKRPRIYSGIDGGIGRVPPPLKKCGTLKYLSLTLTIVQSDREILIIFQTPTYMVGCNQIVGRLFSTAQNGSKEPRSFGFEIPIRSCLADIDNAFQRDIRYSHLARWTGFTTIPTQASGSGSSPSINLKSPLFRYLKLSSYLHGCVGGIRNTARRCHLSIPEQLQLEAVEVLEEKTMRLCHTTPHSNSSPD